MDYYLPGYKSGGPLHAIAGLVEALGSEFNFMIITSDRDLGDKNPYEGIQRNRWTRHGKAALLYIDRRNPFSVIRNVRETPHDVLYIKSFFSLPFSVWPIWMRAVGMLKKKKIVLAPCGEFSAGALALHSLRKRIYIRIVNRIGLYKRVTWHATSEYEAEDIRREFGIKTRTVIAQSIGAGGKARDSHQGGPHVVVASELGQVQASERHDVIRPAKLQGELRAVFLSRVARNKNLDGALKSLRNLQGHVWFDIYGPLEDQRYWDECQQIIADLPANVRVQHRGFIPHDQVSLVLKKYHLFFFPTQGENFSYAILEALLAGLPILISDQTPWRQLQAAGVGWDLPLNEPKLFHQTLQRCVDMGPEEYKGLSLRALAHGVRYTQDPAVVARNRVLFEQRLLNIRT